MAPELEYDPTANRARLVPKGEDWCVWVERATAEPAIPQFFTRDDVGDAVGDYRLSDVGAVIGYFERCLLRAGYSVVHEDGNLPDAVATWSLGPGSN